MADKRKHKYVNAQSYDTKRKRIDHNEIAKDPEKYGLKPEELEEKTVPGQAISIKELKDRYEKGRPEPVE